MSMSTRGMWVVRTSITSPSAVERIVEIASRHQINTLVAQVRGRGDAYYLNGLEPLADALADAPHFDPLAELIRRTAGSDIRVHAWLNAHFAWEGPGQPQSPRHLVNLHPEWLMRRADGRVASAGAECEGAYTCPSNLDARQHLAAVYLDVARRYSVDGIQFDYIRYPSGDYCYCDSCSFRFREYLRWWDPESDAVTDADLKDLPLRELTARHQPEWDRFRRTQISELVRQVYRNMKAEKPEVLVSAAVFANTDDAYRSRFQDWKSWLAEDNLDVVCPMAYTTDGSLFTAQIKEAVDASRGSKPVWAGIGAYRLDSSDCADRIARAEDAGAAGFLLFSYGAMTNEGASEDYLAGLDG
ncbi:MAG TPA: family 10 glycosylhydrolase [Armatimonadota bacterium]|nr:family 10 glycosylhydrolase [Armatimonadota bacterium]